MIISIWRYSHLALAVSSFAFVLILSVTGIILAFEPIDSALQNQQSANDNPEITLAQTVDSLQERYDELLSLSLDANGFVAVSAITEDGDISDFYINPVTAEKSGEPAKQSELMQFATNLHRSLFLKGPGRFIIGLSSFLLFLIVVSGLVLIIKRQQGLRNFFQKIIKENFTQYAHVYLGRLALIPLVLITLTGVYLSLLRFSVIPNPIPTHTVNYEDIQSSPQIPLADFPIFKNTPLSEVRSLEFPFSPDAADTYKLSLQKKELIVNQITGEILSESSYPVVVFFSEWATIIHTGRGSIWWSVILGLSSVAVLFFIYSGFRMTFKRRASRIKNTYRKNECKYIILVGSETGTTMHFARTFHARLKTLGVKSYMAQMNDFEPYEKMENLIVFTATYGQGEAPANATKFIKRLQEATFRQSFNYSVVGFGSLAYPDFCKFAFDTDAALLSVNKSARLMETFTINSRSNEAFSRWAEQWSQRTGLQAFIPKSDVDAPKIRRKKTFEVLTNTKLDDTFLLLLKPSKSVNISSGDLLGVFPDDGSQERLYSIGITRDGNLLMSIKIHEKGVCSNYLSHAKQGSIIEGRLVKNKDFHFPKRAKSVLLISSGTGIAPFLGMLDQNSRNTETSLYWGGKNPESFKLYESRIEMNRKDARLTHFEPAFSRTQSPKRYVQDLILRDAEMVAKILKQKGFIMICGSIAMQKGVTETLHGICMEINKKPLSYYQKKGRIKMDCY